jgi:hypothetical protein
LNSYNIYIYCKLTSIIKVSLNKTKHQKLPMQNFVKEYLLYVFFFLSFVKDTIFHEV